ncbi:MAG: hypothetical protein J7L61_01935 [Thermoplasmata archaeon]|nr:hypothetical protein [Thermoplasmata archaeon]
MKLQTQKLDDIRFKVNHSLSAPPVALQWKAGELFLTLRGLVIKDEDRWYEIAVKDLVSITVLEEEPKKIALCLGETDVIITGDNAEFLDALRHFLLPYVRKEETSTVMGDFLKLWALGLHDTWGLANVLGVGEEVVQALLEDAEARGLIRDGRLTGLAREHLLEKDQRLLEDMGVFHD